MTTIYLTEEQLVEILTIMHSYGLIDLRRARVDMQYTTERIRMYLEAKATVKQWIHNS